ncbi:lipoprotein [Spiroplasma floricola]|uniref:Lipoprotein n=1 Tax=Spiroplasma floricola 23-6 TaxID=1336749 RepID=A0A2K8SDV8_9MOLU|nr:lipoprotein [Spiroplasma floricola]AUB31641.1 hypothetical protein SFLOR_v1c05890 [Spiroplasma floricola 23-6]
MKKMLTILTGLSIIVTPATQIVSCNIATNNTYKTASDIAKFWNFKYFNTISVDYTSSQTNAQQYNVDTSNIETNIKELIAHNFRNQEEVNKLLGIKQTEGEINNDITFTYYSAPKVKISNLSEYLETEFKDVKEPKKVEIYFTYKLKDYEDKNYLKLNITNVPKMKKEVFSTYLFLEKFNNQNNIDIENSFIADLRKIAEKQNDKKITANLLEKNKKTTLNFIKGMLTSLEKITKIKLSDDLQYVKNENLHDPKVEWRRVTPEEQLFRLLFEKNSDSITDFVTFINELCDKDKNSSTAFSKWLGLPQIKNSNKDRAFQII